MNSKLIYLIPVIAFGIWWRAYFLNSTNMTSDDSFTSQVMLDPQEPLLKATGCGMGPRVVRVNLGDLAGFAGDPSILARELARRRLSSEVRCNKSTQLFSVQWHMAAGGSRSEDQYKYDRKMRTLSYAHSWTMMAVPKEKPLYEVHRDVSDEFVSQGHF